MFSILLTTEQRSEFSVVFEGKSYEINLNGITVCFDIMLPVSVDQLVGNISYEGASLLRGGGWQWRLPMPGWHVRSWGPGCQGNTRSMLVSLLPHDLVFVSGHPPGPVGDWGVDLEEVSIPHDQRRNSWRVSTVATFWPTWPSTPVGIRPFSLDRAHLVARMASHRTIVWGK